jgi:hypothetical protein
VTEEQNRHGNKSSNPLTNSTIYTTGSEADTLAVVKKPTNQSILAEKSGHAAWKELPIWYQIF